MGPRLISLASLALLLLALCRQSSAGVHISVKSVNTMSSGSSIAFSSKQVSVENKQKAVAASEMTLAKTETDTKKKDLVEKMGNTIVMLGLILSEQKPVDYFLKSLAKGVFCEAAQTGIEDTIVKAGFNHADEAAFTKGLSGEAKVDCDGNAPDASNTDPKAQAEVEAFTCFCTKKKPLLFCSSQQLNTVLAVEPALVDVAKTTVPCLPQALVALKNAAPTLYEEYNADTFGSATFENEFSGASVKSEDETYAKVLCEATKDDVENAVAAVYAADGSYWLAESVLYAIVFGANDKPLSEICQEPEFVNDDYGKCVCQQKTGFTFCIYKTLGIIFKTAGYIECSGTIKFVPTKKPAALPKLAKRAPAPVTAATVPSGGGSTVAPTPAAGAATSILPLAPAAAAAALLLMRH